MTTLNRQSVWILTSYCAKHRHTADTFVGVAQAVLAADPKIEAEWRTHVDDLNAPRLQRDLEELHNAPDAPINFDELIVDQAIVQWQGVTIGRIHIAYKSPLPYEAQARMAYEIFYDRFVEFVAQEHKAAILQNSDVCLQIFIPDVGCTLAYLWQQFVEYAFSAEQLAQSFALLINTVRLAERGFSALSLPILTLEQAQFLAAFNLKNVQSLEEGDRKRRREIEQIDHDLEEAEERKVPNLLKKQAKIEKELSDRQKRYQPLYKRYRTVAEKHPSWFGRVQQLARRLSPLAGTQIAKAGAKIGKAVTQIEEYAVMAEGQLYQLPALISAEIPLTQPRPAGDGGKTCYACGRLIDRTEAKLKLKANKFIFASPSQRLQSGGSKSEPKICGACAALAFISPVKVIDTGLIMRFEASDENQQRTTRHLENLLRSFVTAQMNIVTGRYALINASETASNKPLIGKLGATQYALWRIGTHFDPVVFRQYEACAVIKDASVKLPRRHLIAIRRLHEIFNLYRPKWDDKSEFGALSRVIRHIQQDQLTFAVYELIKAGFVTNLSLRHRAELETLNKEYNKLLMNNVRTKSKAELLCDVAVATGLLLPFCNFVYGRVKGSEGAKQAAREVSKIIERSGNPNYVAYTAAQHTGQQNARLYYGNNTHFIYDQLKTRLDKLGISKQEESGENDSRYLALSFDDLSLVYTDLLEQYRTAKQERDFSYQLKLSLYARFPEAMPSSSSKKEQ